MKCKTCRGELRWDEPRECWTCDHCHPVGEVKSKFNDGAIPEVIFEPYQEDEIMSICGKMIAAALNVLNQAQAEPEEVVPDEPDVNVGDWRGQAKSLDIPLYDKENKCPRKKVDVLLDIQEKLVVGDSPSPEQDDNETP